MPFIALEVALDLIRSLNQPVAMIRARSCSLAGQIDAAAESVALNLGEGRRRAGKIACTSFESPRAVRTR